MARRGEDALPVVRVSGDAGALRVGYHEAARLGRWQLALQQAVPRAFTLDAEVAARDPYWMTQGPFDLALVLGRSAWVWRGVVVAPDADRVRLTVSSRPEVESAS